MTRCVMCLLKLPRIARIIWIFCRFHRRRFGLTKTLLSAKWQIFVGISRKWPGVGLSRFLLNYFLIDRDQSVQLFS